MKRGWAIAVLTTALVGPTAAAQTSPEPDEPPAEPAPSADEESEPPAEEEPSTDPLERARALFAKGIAAVRRNEWGEALTAFEASSALRAHAVTTYNMGACYRAMARYTRARSHFAAALARHETQGELPPHLLEESQRYLEETDGLLATLPLEVAPTQATVAVDGAPLAAEGSALVAGIRPAGKGERLAGGKAALLLDPGAHVIVVSAPGYEDRVVNRSLSPGKNAKLRVKLEPLRAELRVRADQPDTSVFLDERYLGLAPLDLRRPAGAYALRLTTDGYEPYETTVQLASGKEHLVQASMVEDSPSVLESWWFWTAAGVVVTGAVVGTYFATRPDARRPPLDGGGLGWVVPLE